MGYNTYRNNFACVHQSINPNKRIVIQSLDGCIHSPVSLEGVNDIIQFLRKLVQPLTFNRVLLFCR